MCLSMMIVKVNLRSSLIFLIEYFFKVNSRFLSHLILNYSLIKLFLSIYMKISLFNTNLSATYINILGNFFMIRPELFFPELSPIENVNLPDHESQFNDEVILVISIDIEPGRSDKIQVYEHDDPEQLAVEFTQKHKLGVKAKMILTDEIKKHLKVAISRVITLNCMKTMSKFQLDPTPEKSKQTFSEVSMKVKQNLASSTTITPDKSEKKYFSGYLAAHAPSNKSKTEKINQIPKPRGRNAQITPNKRYNPLLMSPDPHKSIASIQNLTNKKWPYNSLDSNFKEIFNIENKKNAMGNSQKIMKKVKQQKYDEIFQLLRPNTNGIISAETVKRGGIPENVQKILQPLLEELEEMKETLNFSEFCDAMDMLMKVISPGDKSALMSPCKPRERRRESPSFRPKINQDKSQHSRNLSVSSLYDRGLQKKQELSRRLLKEKMQMQEAELKECKFIPTVTNPRRNYSKIES